MDIRKKNIVIKSCYKRHIKYVTLIICEARISLWNVNVWYVDLTPQNLPDSKLMSIRRLFWRRKVKDGKSEQFFLIEALQKLHDGNASWDNSYGSCQLSTLVPVSSFFAFEVRWESECPHRIDIPSLSGSSLGIAPGSFWLRTLDLRLDLSFSDPVLTMRTYINISYVT